MEATSFNTTLRDLATKEPDAPALTCGRRTLTRAELARETSRVARHLAGLGVGQGDRVTIALPNSIGFVESMLACWLLGATPQPISHRLPAAERLAIVELAEPTLVIGLSPEEAGGRPALADVDGVAADRSSDSRPPPEPKVAPIWKIVTSGGSTGRPKLIVATQAAYTEQVLALGAMLHFPTDGSLLVTGPMSHNAPLVVAAVGLLTGNHVVVMPRFDAEETLRLVEEHHIEWLYLVPTMMQRIWRLPDSDRLGRDLSSLKVVFHMAAPCPPWLKQAWIDWVGAEVVLELYGGTELQAITVLSGVEWLDHPGSVGRPVIGEMEIRQEGVRTATGEPGLIWMRRGPGVPSPYEYIGATAKAAEDGWESLGDIGYMDADGYLYLTDRESDMIVVGGANVYPAEIEAALDEHPAVRSSCVIGLPHEDLGSAPHALVQLDIPTDDEALFAHLRERLAPYKVPRSIERVDHPLRDDAGKVRRSALRADRVGRTES